MRSCCLSACEDLSTGRTRPSLPMRSKKATVSLRPTASPAALSLCAPSEDLVLEDVEEGLALFLEEVPVAALENLAHVVLAACSEGALMRSSWRSWLLRVCEEPVCLSAEPQALAIEVL